jgi:hypothetical protein
MQINTLTGEFTWTPSEEQGPGNYQVTLKVADDGEPLASATQPLTITVAEVNVAPTLQVVSQAGAHPALTLEFSASASDVDIPSNVLKFSLVGEVLSGATIDPDTGLFQWLAGAASTNTVTVQVSDGSPGLSDSQAVTLLVKDLVITEAQVDSSQVRLLWESVPGVQYSVESSVEPGSPWEQIGYPVISSDWTSSFTNALPQDGKALFRIRTGN